MSIAQQRASADDPAVAMTAAGKVNVPWMRSRAMLDIAESFARKANREQTRKSYELFARYVMPHFQGSGEGPRGSNEWARGNRKTIFSPNVEAIRQAFTNAGREVPAEFRQRTSGARDLDSTPGTTP